MLEEKVIVRNEKSVQKVSKQHGKSDMRYWTDKVFKTVYARGGDRVESADYSVKLQFKGQRDTFNLHTPNKASAVARARDVYLSLQSVGWPATVERFKSGGAVATPKAGTTVGEFISELTATTGRVKTIAGYASAFRRIISDIFEISGDNSRFDYQRGGNAKWVSQIDAVLLSDVSPDRIQRWKIQYLNRAGSNPLLLRAAKISVNSLLRESRSLFAKGMTKHLRHTVLPSPLPFDGIDFEERQNQRYSSTFDVLKLITAAREELAEAQPEQFKILLLASMVGLRRGEIDSLQWSSFLWDKNVVRIQATETFSPKSEKSLGDIDVDPELMAVFRGFQARATGVFVVESKNEPRPGTYRSQRHIEGLLKWLKAHGVAGRKPLHDLRKEFGSLVNEQFGIFAASRALRHASVSVTESHYADKRNRSAVGLGHLLASNVVEFSSAKKAI